MDKLSEKAQRYTVEKTNEIITQAIAQAYADGYRNGYKDCEEKIPVDLRDNMTEYVDLGLPSGTLWSTDYEKESNLIMYTPYEYARRLNIPTYEQCHELFKNCCFKTKKETLICMGPNGKEISFSPTGYYSFDKEPVERPDKSFFWIIEYEKTCFTASCMNDKKTDHYFKGYKLPIRLVQIKKDE